MFPFLTCWGCCRQISTLHSLHSCFWVFHIHLHKIYRKILMHLYACACPSTVLKVAHAGIRLTPKQKKKTWRIFVFIKSTGISFVQNQSSGVTSASLSSSSLHRQMCNSMDNQKWEQLQRNRQAGGRKEKERGQRETETERQTVDKLRETERGMDGERKTQTDRAVRSRQTEKRKENL